MESNTYWNYRVLQNDQGYWIIEVYYTDGKITMWTEEPCNPYGETVEDLKGDMELKMRAFNLPPVKVVDGMLQDVSLT